jgi:hypothetical protein
VFEIITTAIPQLFALVDGVPLMAKREIVKMKTSKTSPPMIM